MMQNPLKLNTRALLLWMRGRVHFTRTGRMDVIDDCGEIFQPFRKVTVERTNGQPEQPDAIFQIRFRFKNLSPTANRMLSLIPIPMIIAQPGFRSKTWLLGQQTGDFIGLYEFDTIADAEAYWHSLPLRIMRMRAVPDSLTHNIRKR
jgi:hypothetical protein